MCVGQRGHGLVFVREFCQQGHHVQQLAAHYLQPLAHDKDIGIVAHIAAGGPQMDDALCLRALHAVGIDVAHHVVAALLFPGGGHIVIDVVLVRLQLGDLRVGDGQALLLLGLRQRDPQPAPRLEFIVLREDVLHLFRRVTRLERGNIGIVCHCALLLQFEVIHAALKQLLVFVAVHVLIQVVAAALGMAHLAQHAAVRAGDALHGIVAAVGVVAHVHGGLAGQVYILGGDLPVFH